MLRRGSAVMRIIGSTLFLAQLVLTLSLDLNAEVAWSKLSLNELLEQAESGNAGAQHELAKRYCEGATVPRDSASALKWFR
jgi:TPR repeat protein